MTKVCHLRFRGGPRAPLQPRLARLAAAETRRCRRSLSETLLVPRYQPYFWTCRTLFPVVMAMFACSEARLQGGGCFGSRPSCSSSARGKAASGSSVAHALCRMAAQPLLRILCLAGFRQSERGFREKTGALRKALRGRAELVCLSGPHPVVDAAGSEGARPDSGERSPARKCAQSFLFCFVRVTPACTQPPCPSPHSCHSPKPSLLLIFLPGPPRLLSISSPGQSVPRLIFPRLATLPQPPLFPSFPNPPSLPLFHFPWISPCLNSVLCPSSP